MPPQTPDVPRRSRTLAVASGLGLTAIIAVALAGAAGRVRTVPVVPAEAPAAAAAAPAQAPAIAPVPPERVVAVTSRLRRDQTFAQALFDLDVDGTEVRAVVDALRGLFPFHRARPGDQLRLERREGERGVQLLTYRQGPADEWIVERL